MDITIYKLDQNYVIKSQVCTCLVRKGLELAELRHERGSGAAPKVEDEWPRAGLLDEIRKPHLTF